MTFYGEACRAGSIVVSLHSLALEKPVNVRAGQITLFSLSGLYFFQQNNA